MKPEPQSPVMPEAARHDHWRVLLHAPVNGLYGLLAGAVTAGTLILFDVGSVGTLIGRSTDPLLAAATVIVPFAVLFGGAAAALAIALLVYRRKFRR
jgi:hypothetical protein